MARLPTVMDMGERPTPAPQRAIVGYNTPSIAEAVQEASGLSQAGAQLGAIADNIMKAEEAIMTREAVVDAAGRLSAFSEAAQQQWTKLQSEADIADLGVLTDYGSFLRQQRDEILAAHKGTAETRARLAARLEAERSRFATNAGEASTIAGKKRVQGLLGNNLQAITASVGMGQMPLNEAFSRLDGLLEDFAPALSPDEEVAYRDSARQEITLSKLNSVVERGGWRQAQQIMDENPGILEMLAPADQRRIVGRIGDMERAETETAMAARRKIADAEAIKGAPLTAQERLRLAGLAPEPAQQTLSGKLREIENALGRPLEEEERLKALGLQIERNIPKNSDVAGLRKEYTTLAKDFIQVRDAFGRIESAASTPSPAGDLALIFNFMKMLDPGSTVREGEFANAQNAASVPGRVQSVYNNIISGERLTPEQRVDFINQSRGLMQVQRRTYDALGQTFRGIAERNGFNPDDVVIDLTANQDGGTRPGGGGGAGGDTPSAGGKRRIRIDLDGNVIQGQAG